MDTKKEVWKYKLWLYWWLFFVLVMFGFAGLHFGGIISLAWQSDLTKISFVIVALFFIFSLRTGKDIYTFCKKDNDFSGGDIARFCQKNEDGWYRAEQFLSLGILGTVLGFIIAFSKGFSSIDAKNISASLPSVIQIVSSGLGSALYTTAAGLVCCLLLREQLFNFQKHVDKAGRTCGCKEVDSDVP